MFQINKTTTSSSPQLYRLREVRIRQHNNQINQQILRLPSSLPKWHNHKHISSHDGMEKQLWILICIEKYKKQSWWVLFFSDFASDVEKGEPTLNSWRHALYKLFEAYRSISRWMKHNIRFREWSTRGDNKKNVDGNVSLIQHPTQLGTKIAKRFIKVALKQKMNKKCHHKILLAANKHVAELVHILP